MEFEVDVAALREAVSRAAKAVPGHAPVPALSGVLMEAGEGTVRVTGTNLDAWIWAECPAVVHTAGAVVAPAKVLGDLLGALEGAAALSADAGTVRVLSGKGRYELAALDPDSFPRPPETDGEAVTLDGAKLRTVLAQALSAAPREAENRLARVCWDGEGWLVATDAVRLAACRFVPPPGGKEMVLPTAAALALAKSGFGEGDVGVRRAGALARFAWEGGGAAVRLVPTPYPNWRRVSSVVPQVTAKVPLDELADALARAVAAAGNGFPATRVSVSPTAIDLELVSNEGKLCEEIACEADGSLEVRFNAGLLLDGVRALARGGEKEARWILGGEEQAALLSGPEEDGGGCRYVVLPLKK